jgi:uncharacterized membrane protein YraQ (UPF0718 family)
MKDAAQRTIKNIETSIPILVGILMLLSLLELIFDQYYTKIFTGNWLFDPLIGTVVGSISVGVPVASYVIGGQLLEQGVTLLAVTAFVFSWTTVGVMLMPLEAKSLGRKFTLVRNGLNFTFSIVIAMCLSFVFKFL